MQDRGMAPPQFQKLEHLFLLHRPDVCRARDISSAQGRPKGRSGTYSSSMQGASVAPNRTRLPRPVHSGNAIMVPRDGTHHVIPNDLVFVVIDIVDPGNMQPDTGE